MKVLIVGNIIKDVYLEFNENLNKFELDDQGTPWLDLAFDGGSHNYSRRTAIYGGASITLEVIRKLGIRAEISGRNIKTSANGRTIEFSDGKPCEVYRYIFTHDNKVTYIAPSARALTKLTPPKKPVDWIYIDRSANTSDELLHTLEKYLEVSPETKIAVFASTRGCGCSSELEMRDNGKPGSRIFSSVDRKLIQKADLIFTDGPLFDLKPEARICRISDNEIRLDDKFRHYYIPDNERITHLTSYSVIAATVLAALLSKHNLEDALDLAVINAENASLKGVMDKDSLHEKLAEVKQDRENLRLNARALVAHPKGILAADESGGSIHKKFAEANIPDDAAHRRDYRNIFFTTEGLADYINGVILFEETANQLADDGSKFVDYLTSLGIIPGIKVDQGLTPFTEPGYETENWTKGLDDLPERLANFYKLGARFAKWRAAFEVTFMNGDENTVRTPSKLAINKNAEILAKYARACQDAGIVPIVEPEVVHDGNYSIEVCAEVTGKILDETFRELEKYEVDLAGCLLKCNMVLAGKKYKNPSTPDEIGEWTGKVLREHVPDKLAGVVFLSGGQGIEESTINLQAVTNHGPYPWPVTFSYARALQGPALDAWQGDNANVDAARAAFKERLIANCDALTPDSEQ